MSDQSEIINNEMHDKPVIAVTMATSRQGLGVVHELVKTNKYQIRAITRNTNSIKARELANLNNVNVVSGDLLDPLSLHKAFEGVDWFHFTGITPALSSSAAEVTSEATSAAKDLGLTVSADMNYRKNLWSPEEAQSIMKPLMKNVDIAIGNEEDACYHDNILLHISLKMGKSFPVMYVGAAFLLN